MVGLGRQPGSIAMPKYPYRRVADDLRARITAGEFPPGAKLPTRKQLAAHYGVSDIVIGAAMRELASAGVTESLPGVGVYVAEPHDGN